MLLLWKQPRISKFSLCSSFGCIKGFSRVYPCYACTLPKGFLWIPPLLALCSYHILLWWSTQKIGYALLCLCSKYVCSPRDFCLKPCYTNVLLNIFPPMLCPCFVHVAPTSVHTISIVLFYVIRFFYFPWKSHAVYRGNLQFSHAQLIPPKDWNTRFVMSPKDFDVDPLNATSPPGPNMSNARSARGPTNFWWPADALSTPWVFVACCTGTASSSSRASERASLGCQAPARLLKHDPMLNNNVSTSATRQ